MHFYCGSKVGSYNILENSPTSLVHNSVFIGPNYIEFGTDAYMHVVWSGRLYQNLGQIDHNLHNHFLCCHMQTTGTSNAIDSTKID